MSSVKIKICGITSSEDARVCLKAGADYIGLNFCPRSPRYVKPETAKGILAHLRMQGFEKVYAVGVFVNAGADEVRRVADLCGLRIVQLHGEETAEDIDRLAGFLRIKAVKAVNAASFDTMGSYGADAYLADSPHPTLAGGTGKPYDFSMVAEVAKRHRIFLAGGLTPQNVAAAIIAARPFAVDVASGVELKPGKKDPKKIEAFCRAARELEVA